MLQETRTISFFEWSWTATDVPHIPQIGHQFSVCKSITNGILGKNAPFGVQHPSALFQRSRSKGDVSGHNDIVIFDLLYNPIICGVILITHNNLFQKFFLRNPHPGVGNHVDFKPVTFGNS